MYKTEWKNDFFMKQIEAKHEELSYLTNKESLNYNEYMLFLQVSMPRV